GPPQERSRLPSASNSSTGGADTQHFERGGVRAAPFSSSVSERGRWITQIWPCASTVMPPTWPRIQLFGSGFGQDASTAKVGMSPACEPAGAAISIAAVKQAEMALERCWRARLRVGVMSASRWFFLAGYPAWEAVNRGEEWESTYPPSLQAKRSNPSCGVRGCMDCFVASLPSQTLCVCRRQ